MKLGIMQPYFFPYIGYFQLLNAVDKYVIYDDVNYIKGGWINRNRILSNGKAIYYNIQLKDASPFKKINEIEVFDNSVHKRKMLATLRGSYSKAPYFNQVYPILEDIIMQEEKNLAKYLIYSLRRICNYLNIETEIIVSSSLRKNNDLKGQDKVIDICKILNASEYYNAIGGQELYDYDEFNKNNIKLYFLKSNDLFYEQFNNEFIPSLSIIDVMMFNSPKKISELLNSFELIN